jgi:multicomponent Na+:H+ antiporter subunit B
MTVPESHSFSIVVRTTARYVVRVMMIFGFYVMFHGQISHGDGFAGGVILGLAFIMMMLVFGTEAAMRYFSRPLAPRLVSVGGLFFLTIAISGFSGGYYLFNFIGQGQVFKVWGAGIVPLCNVAIGLMTTTCLIGIYAGLTRFKPGPGGKQ